MTHWCRCDQAQCSLKCNLNFIDRACPVHLTLTLRRPQSIFRVKSHYRASLLSLIRRQGPVRYANVVEGQTSHFKLFTPTRHITVIPSKPGHH